MKRFTALAAWSVILSACQNGGAEPAVTTLRDSAGVEIVENAGDLWSAPARWQASAEPVVRWVGEYRFDTRPAQQFLVFDAEGRFTGRAAMPPSLRVMAIRDGRVWGRQTDELGVEYVVAHVLEEI